MRSPLKTHKLPNYLFQLPKVTFYNKEKNIIRVAYFTWWAALNANALNTQRNSILQVRIICAIKHIKKLMR